ncbi:MAG TPA: VanZ family protein [bacterium]|nr:VanZ family protein [bacterium]
MENTKCRVGPAIRWLAVAAYAGFLFYLSSLHHVSLPRFPFSDKFVHAFFYAGFGSVFVWAFDPLARGWAPARVLLTAGLAAFLYGVTDEFHQRFVRGRSPEAADLIFDALGGLLGGGLYLALRRKGKAKTHDSPVVSL